MRAGLLAALLAGAAPLAGCNPNEQGHVRASRIGDVGDHQVLRQRFDRREDRACGPGGPTPRGEHHLIRRPYLQQTTASSTLIVWGADRPARVEIWPASDRAAARWHRPTLGNGPPRGGQQYVVHIEDLDADRVYCYRIATTTEVWQSPTGFATAPAEGQPRPARFAVLGDLGQATPDQMLVREQLETVDFDFALIAGDVAYDSGSLSELERYVFDVYADLLQHVPCFVAAGNHDYEVDDGESLRRAFALPETGGPRSKERWYSFDWGPVHVVVLDSETDLRPQRAWLDADLRATDRPWKVVVIHRPPFASGYHRSDLWVRQILVPIFIRRGVDLVFSGHEHHYERSRAMRGVHYVVTGGGGRGTRPVGENPFTAFSLRVAHFVYVVADRDTLTLYAIDATGTLFDALELER